MRRFLQFSAVRRVFHYRPSRAVLAVGVIVILLGAGLSLALVGLGRDGETGPARAGAEAPKGAKHEKGHGGREAAVMVRSQSVTVPGGPARDGNYTTKAVTAACDPSETAIGGGSRWSSGQGAELVTVDGQLVGPAGHPSGYRAQGGSDVAADTVFTVQVVCMEG